MDILKRFGEDAEYAALAGAVQKGSLPVLVNGLCEAARCAFCCALASDAGRPAVVVVPDEKEAYRLYNGVAAYTDRAAVFPARDFVFDAVSARSRDFEQARLGVLTRILSGTCDLVITVPDALMQYTMPRSVLESGTVRLARGERVDVAALTARLAAMGYTRCELVEGAGQFSLRGGILDVFSPGSAYPCRVDFFGDEIDLLGYFDTVSQRRYENTTEYLCIPADEVLFSASALEKTAQAAAELASRFQGDAKALESLRTECAQAADGIPPAAQDKYFSLVYDEKATLLSYLDDCFVLLFETSRIAERIRAFSWQTHETLELLVEQGRTTYALAGVMQESDALLAALAGRSVAADMFMQAGGMFSYRAQFTVQANPTSPLTENTALFLDDAKDYLAAGRRVMLCVSSPRAMTAMEEKLRGAGVVAYPYDGTLRADAVAVNDGSRSLNGFELPRAGFVLMTDAEIGAGGKQKRVRAAKMKKSERISSYADLSVGDLVVHANHGIGRYVGLQTVTTEGVSRDYIKLQYAGSDCLYVPCNQLDLVSKYIGSGGESVAKLSKMGSSEWQRAKAKAKSSAQGVAKELIALYAARQRMQGHAFPPDDELQEEFEAQFEYAETDGQLEAVAEIKRDMERAVPMDRLLCGDVGFGKTEVALRAAFKCVSDGMQVAVLVPTTILAWQHYQTMLSRFRGFPVKVEMLSRFRTAGQQREILKDLKCGKIDIVVGTHRLLQKDVGFKNLGLMIVDEEQRFGVTHKERLKQLAVGIDCLTLTATPIPRTLNMALSGIRDMSVLEEAPQDRVPVQTYVAEYDDVLLREAVRRELRRGGQVFYLHNYIDTVYAKAASIGRDFPDASIAVAHGKMSKEELSEVWQGMVNGEVDILVCTTIIETGIDVPNANTLIIEDADRMGLSQLHQIRGRVGRSSRKAYAYFTYRRGGLLSEIASKRLQAVREFTEFGSGFKIAMRDLELRGAGNLLGAEQSGCMEAVGYDLYIKILEDAVNAEKGIYVPSVRDCLIDINVNAYIADAYIPSSQQRIDVYRKIAHLESADERDDLLDELSDRYGELPAPVSNLVDISLLRNAASLLGFASVEQKGALLSFFSDAPDMERIAALAMLPELRGRITASGGKRSHFSYRLEKGENSLTAARRVLELYTKLSQKGIDKSEELRYNNL